MESPDINHAFDGCDESKCVSQGGWSHFSDDTRKSFANSFTCYGDEGKFYPKMCADGFVPVTVEGEPTLSSADWYGKEDSNITVSYFTCCPPTAATATRRCSDPIVTSSSEDATCGQDDTFVYPRPMKSNTLRLELFGPLSTFVKSETGIDSHLCCDYNDTESLSTDFLDDTECVPYRNEDYNGFFRDNQIGSAFALVYPVVCDFPDDSFSIPQPSATSRFQCCKSGTPMPPYIQDTTFNINVYSSIVMFGISAIISLIVVTSLLIPFLKAITKLKNEDRDRTNKTQATSLGSSGSFRRVRRTQSTRLRRTQSVRMGEYGFSTYNVYLIYLSFLDLIWCLYGLAVRALYINQVFVPNTPTTSISLSIAYFAGNFWINAIILHEMFLLLKASKAVKRTQPPSLKRLNMQGGMVYALVVVYGLIVGLYFIPKGNLWVFVGVNCVVTFPPIFYVTGLPFWIWWYEYLPPAAIKGAMRSKSVGARAMRDKAIRDMALYFFRVVFVFVILFMPLSVFLLIVKPWRNWPGYVNECILAVQPAITFGFLLTKPDVKQYVLDLVTLKYLFGDEKTKKMIGAKRPKGVKFEPGHNDKRKSESLNTDSTPHNSILSSSAGNNDSSYDRCEPNGVNDDDDNINVDTGDLNDARNNDNIDPEDPMNSDSLDCDDDPSQGSGEEVDKDSSSKSSDLWLSTKRRSDSSPQHNRVDAMGVGEELEDPMNSDYLDCDDDPNQGNQVYFAKGTKKPLTILGTGQVVGMDANAMRLVDELNQETD